MLGTLIQGRISVSGASISASKVALTIAVRRALERRQFGPPGGSEALLLDYRTHQRRLLPALAGPTRSRSRSSGWWTSWRRRSRSDDERARRKLETLAAGVKAVATWHASETIQSCREACGGAGYLRTSRFAALKADTDVFTTFEGDNTILLQLAAKNLLTDYRDAFGELDPLGLAQFVAGQALSVLSERTPLGKLTDTGDLLARETQLDLFRWRHEHLLESAAKRLKRGIDAGEDPFSVLIDCQDHVLEAARSWVDLVVLESFPEDPVLDPVRSLYALSTIEAERGYYQEHGRLSGARSKAVIKAVNALCGELRPGARALVDAFGVPENVLGRRARGRRGGDRVRTRLPRAEREAQMLSTARALFAARGYADVTMDEVAARRRRHETAALQLLRQQGAALPGLHEAGGGGARRRGRLGRPGRGRRPGRAARRHPRLLRVPGRRRRGVAAAARRDAARRRRDRRARGFEYRARMEALVTASIRSESRAVEPLSVAIFGAAEALGRWWLRTGELSAERTAELLIRTIEPGLRMR